MNERYQYLVKRIEDIKAEREGRRPKYPSLLQMARNFLTSMADVGKEFVKGNDLLVEEDEFLDRLEICCGCTLFDPEGVRCTDESCGCFLKAKGRLAAMICPLYLWPGDMEKSILGLETDDAEEETD